MKAIGGTQIGLVGTGWTARHFLMSLDRQPGLLATRVLTRRAVDEVRDFPRPDLLTNSLNALIDQCDVIVECSGDPIHATDVVEAAFAAGLPVVTMNAEFHITAGSRFVGRGLLTEASGDQPGVLALLAREARSYGFEPLVYGNLKGFLNRNPSIEDMTFWGAKSGITLPMVTSFTDGTKIQVEQALVANGLGADILRPGLLGPAEEVIQTGADLLCREAERLGRPIADYLIAPKLPHGVFVAGRHDERMKDALRYLKLGEGPYYVVLRHNIYVFLEIANTIRELLDEGRVLLDNGRRPVASVATVAKRTLEPGERIDVGIGSFAVRGEAVRIAETPGHLPIGLLADAVVRRRIPAGAMLAMDDVEMRDDSLAHRAWRDIEEDCLAASAVSSSTRAAAAG
jgi:predicted homoserine dehydrogenase-like protein